MKNLEFQLNTHLAAAYYNEGEPNLFRIHVDITLGDLKHQLIQFNSRCLSLDQRRVTDIEYHVRRSAQTELSCSRT
jgi:hypothetical protein